MRGVRGLSRGWPSVVALVLSGLALSGCETFQGKPARLYTVAEEVTNARDSLPSLVDSYRLATSDNDRMFYRNEYISRRMYIIGAEFTEFEVALTREREEFGFSTALVGQGLSTAGAVFTPVNTVRTLSALSGGVNASRGFYDSELLVNKTIQIIQAQMEAKRDDVSTNIIKKMSLSATLYPLSAALNDLEDLYRAGTLTAGFIKATAEAGNSAQQSADLKQAAIQGGVFQPTDDTTRRLITYFSGATGQTRLRAISLCLFNSGKGIKSGSGGPPDPMLYLGANNLAVRQKMITCSQTNGDPA
jgi:hypothetical protein